MNKINRVIFFRILRTTFYSTLALTLCAWIVQSSRYLNMLGQYNISLARFFKFSSYLCVDIVAAILPISLTVSAAFVFHRFIQSNQLIAIQASGISPNTLLAPLMSLSALTFLYLNISNAYISPNAWSTFRRIEFEIKNNIEPPESAGSIFSINGFSVYAQKYRGNFSFDELFILDLRLPQKVFSYYAKSGSIINNTLILQKGERIEIDNESKKDSITKFDTYQYDLRDILKAERAAAQPNEKYMDELWRTKGRTDTASISQYALFHQKVAGPWLVFLFSFLCFAIIVQAPYKRVRKYFRIFVLILLIVAFQGTFFWISNAAAKDLKFVPFIYALVLLPTVSMFPAIWFRSR